MATASDRQTIRELIESWVVWRDAGKWKQFASLWHQDGWMSATWFQAPAAEFIAGARAGFERGVIALHRLGGSTIEIAGDRAVAHTQMQIVQRGAIDGVSVDVECSGRFLDAWCKEAGVWQLVYRQPAYELDRMEPIEPGATITLDPALLAQFPVGYRHLAYLQTKQGLSVDPRLPGTRGPEIVELEGRLAEWLRGAAHRSLRTGRATR